MLTNTGNNYPNPLDHFRSYSYHFILTMASTTEAFRKMTGNSDGRSPLIDAVNNVKRVGDEVVVDTSTAYLLLDTRRFSQFSITDFETNHIYGTGSRVNPSTPATLAKMKVTDSTGFLFFNLIMETMRNKLRTTRASAFFLLTVLFVGHKDDGSTETVSTCYIPMTLAQLGMEFNSAGSIYDIDFIELEGSPQNGAGGDRLNYLGEALAITTEGFTNDLGGMLDSLERKLNVLSLAFYEKFSNNVVTKANNEDIKSFGKLVQYMITIPKEWRAFKLTAAAKSKNEEQMFVTQKSAEEKKSSANGQPSGKLASSSVKSNLSFSNTTSITDALKIILECSQDLLDLASEEKRNKGEAMAYKTILNTTCDDNSFVIHFDIMPYYIPKPPKEEKKDKKTVEKIPSSPSDIVKNLISYDYIFTGKNSHITDLKIQYSPNSDVAFDTNLQLGPARSAEVAAKGGQKAKDVRGEANGAEKSDSFAPEIKRNDPIFYAMRSLEQSKNQASMKVEDLNMEQAQKVLKAKQEYTQTFAMLHFLGTTQMTMGIRGNPNLLRKYADRNQRGGIPPHNSVVSAPDLQNISKNKFSNFENTFDTIVAKGLVSAKEHYYREYIQPKLEAVVQPNKTTDPLMNNVDVATLPVFVQINIMAPNADMDGNFSADGGLFTNKFFFTGPYQILMLNSRFSAGEFSQTMTLIPYNIDGSYKLEFFI